MPTTQKTVAKNVRVAVILAIYDAERFLDGCFSTLHNARRDGLDLKVIAVDDRSPDRSAEVIAERWPWVELYRLETNLGFAGANNFGLRKAMEWGADYVYLLNQDTEVEPDFLVQAVNLGEAHPEIGSVQSLLLLHPERDLVNSWGNVVHFLGFGYCLGYRRPRSEAGDAVREIAYGSGAATLFRTEALRRVGMFDDTFFMYHEDLDLGWRLRLNGWKNVLLPQSLVFHKYEFSRSVGKLFYMERNRFLVLFQNLRIWSLVVLLPWLVLAEVPLFFLAVRGGWWRQKVRVYRFVFSRRFWGMVRAKRPAVAGIRRVGDREIVRPFVSGIVFQDVSGPFVERFANPLMAVVWAVVRRLIV